MTGNQSQRSWTTLVTYGALGATALAALMLPDALPQIHAVPAGAESDTVQLMGIIRDFKRAHDDFDTVPVAGYGHYAGNIAEQLNDRSVPTFRGGEPVDQFTITNQVLAPGDDFSVEVRVLGSAIYSGSYHRPITMRLRIGDRIVEPFGPFEQPVEGNLNDDQSATGYANPGANPRRLVLGDVFPAGAQVSVIGRSWTLVSGDGTSNSHWAINREGDTATNSIQVRVLQDGDPVPTANGEYDQVSVADYLSDYIDFADDTMDLGLSQIIYLYELGTAGDDPASDIQDLVVLVSLATDPGYFSAVDNSGVSGGGGGFKVATQWRDVASNPIAPHLCTPLPTPAANIVELVNAPSIINAAEIDSFDSSQGAYGGSNIGPDPTFQAGSPMPSLIVPSIGTYQETYEHDGDATHNIFDDFRCRSFILDNNAKSHIHGDVTIVVEDKLDIGNDGAIELQPGATLTLYALNDFHVHNMAAINLNTGDPRRATIYLLSNGVECYVENFAHVYANFIAPNTRLTVRNHADVYGRFLGEDLDLKNHASMHVDTRPLTEEVIVCGASLADTAGAAGASDTGGIADADTFAQWYADHPGVNLSKWHTITLAKNGDGIYEYASNAFHPIDDMLFRNEGQTHNYNFTYVLQASFVYEACAGQFFEFGGADDAWLFVAGGLAMDRGGVLPGTTQHVDMDRLGLTDGATYQVHFFYAQRQSLQAGFWMRTNIVFAEPSLPMTVTAEFD